ncbi:MAG TPA: ABC transporter permease [Puia sp.]|nr:ABC transporter permease [Puia sp.]
MFKNYFVIAWRNLKRNKAYAFINTFGLSLSIACAILIFTMVTYQLSFEKFNPSPERTYRVVSEFHYNSTEYQPGVPQPLGKAFRNDYSITEKTARVMAYDRALISVTDKGVTRKFDEENGASYAEPEFFDIFNFPLLEGDKATVLKEPNTALITQTLAKKYFGEENAIGKIIRYDNKIDFRITGILKDIPANTFRQQEIYLSYDNLKDVNRYFASDSGWGNFTSGMQFFIRLKPGVTASSVEKSLPAFVKKYVDADDVKYTQFNLQPLLDIHFNTDYYADTSKKYLWALSLIGIFLIVTACVNFVNLATAQALNRSREVGVRKVLGSLRSQLFWQFIAETATISLFALLVAFSLAHLVLPWLNDLFQTKMTTGLFENAQMLTFMALLLVAVIFLSGSYPGLVLARFQPVLALKGKLNQKHIGGFSLRRVLVVTQFVISQLLIIGMIVIASQIHYSKTSDLGFNKDAIITLPIPINDRMKMKTLQDRLSQLRGVENVSLCSQAPAASSNNLTTVRFDNRVKNESWEVNFKAADEKYVPAFGLKLVAGRNIFASDSSREVLVNETFVKKLGLASSQEIIGKMVSVSGDAPVPIVGVVKDFYNQSFRQAIDPLSITTRTVSYQNCAVKLNLSDTKPLLAVIEKTWNDTYPDYVYSYHFLDERIARFYRMDNVMLGLVEGFAGIAILIGCLGLYGLVSFMAVQKTKEIGVRKVLGAGLRSILWLFGKEFARLLVIAFLIAAPVSWWAMNKYLQEFKYRITIGPGIFALAILSTLLVALLTVSYRSLMAAVANPVKSLRAE